MDASSPSEGVESNTNIEDISIPVNGLPVEQLEAKRSGAAKQRLRKRRRKRDKFLKIAAGTAAAALMICTPITFWLHKTQRFHFGTARVQEHHLVAEKDTHGNGSETKEKVSVKLASPSVSSSQKSVETKSKVAKVAKVPLSPEEIHKREALTRKILKISFIVSASTVTTLGLILAVLIMIQDKLVYKPSTDNKGSPNRFDMENYDDVCFYTRDGIQICGWFIRVSSEPLVYGSVPTIIYFHGRDKNASYRLKKVRPLVEKVGCNVLLVSYRGFGDSKGKPNEKGMCMDAESAMDYIQARTDVDLSKLWIYGESLGGAVAVHIADKYQDQLQGLILENTFTSLLDMIKRVHPVLTPVRVLSRNRWTSNLRMPNIKLPILFLSGLRDGFIPPPMMKKLYELAGKSPYKKIVEFPGGTHNRTWISDGFFEAIDSFVAHVVAGSTAPAASASGSQIPESS